MTLAELLSTPPASFSWPHGGIDGNAAPGLAVIGLAWGPHLAIATGEDESVQAKFVAETPAQPWICGHTVVPPAATLGATALPNRTTVVRAQPVSRPPPARATVFVKRR